LKEDQDHSTPEEDRSTNEIQTKTIPLPKKTAVTVRFMRDLKYPEPSKIPEKSKRIKSLEIKDLRYKLPQRPRFMYGHVFTIHSFMKDLQMILKRTSFMKRNQRVLRLHQRHLNGYKP
jgi:hypothetical protein